MLRAFSWGLFAVSSPIMGGMLACRFSLGNRLNGIIMAFGAGTLISAVSHELIFQAVHIALKTGFPSLGRFAGAFTFYGSDWLIARLGGGATVDIDASS